MDKKKFSFIISVDKHARGAVCDFLASHTGLSKTKIKDAMNKGALWVVKKGDRSGKLRRLRKATAMIDSMLRIEFYYDEKLLALKPPQARCIEDLGDYSVWFKPAGLMSQGTMDADHCSLLRQSELFLGNVRISYLVHRLDREAAGLMLIAHTKNAAAQLSKLFRENRIIKQYRAEVLGNLEERSVNDVIDLPLDGKAAFTEYEVKSYDPDKNTSVVDVTIKTGRMHQIRRHFEMIGFPVMGDPKYGNGNKNKEGLKLAAYLLRFDCPINKRSVEFRIQKMDETDLISS
jgi:tRNA pseudouridine32 synthase/23S rRNA pseudouridine746 synthase